MKGIFKKGIFCGTALVAVSVCAGRPASAQAPAAPIVPATPGVAAPAAGQLRFFVELKDATLADALEMVFKAAGNPAHIVDDSARSVNIASSTFPNHDFHSIIRQLTATYNFKFYKNDAGTWVIEPRQPPPPEPGAFGGESGAPAFGGGFSSPGTGPGGFPGARPGGGFNRGGSSMGSGSMGGSSMGSGSMGSGAMTPRGGVPATPFGNTTRPRVQNFANPQAAPAFGAGAGAGADAGGEEKSFRLLTVKHVYVGGIAALFKDAKSIPTQPFVSPMTGGGGFGGQGGGFGGQGGGFGGQGGGFGGQGGFGGGGFGGQGGFGGGGFGGQGGFGGGGFGGGGFGGGGQQFGGGGGFGRRF